MKLGFNRNTARAVAYGPSRYGALGLRDWVVEQGIAQLVMLLRHLRGKTDQGRLLLIALSWWHLYSGTSFQLLQDPHSPLHLGEHHIFSSLRSFLQEIDGSLYVNDLDRMLPSPNRVGDVTILPVLATLPNVSKADLNRCNRVRLFLCVAFLSEISTADSLSIARDAWTGARSRHSPLLWPYQPQPGPKSFQTWRRLLARAFIRGQRKWTGSTLLDLRLRSPLGDWLPDSAWLRTRWSSFFALSTSTVYQHQPSGSYQLHPHKPLRKRPVNPVRGFSLQPSATVSALPSDAIPIDLTAEIGHLTASPRSPRLRLPDNPLPPPVTWEDYLSRLPS
jgi:hypothetical protein